MHQIDKLPDDERQLTFGFEEVHKVKSRIVTYSQDGPPIWIRGIDTENPEYSWDKGRTWTKSSNLHEDEFECFVEEAVLHLTKNKDRSYFKIPLDEFPNAWHRFWQKVLLGFTWSIQGKLKDCDE